MVYLFLANGFEDYDIIVDSLDGLDLKIYEGK